jgi:hypothetical protein
MRILLTNSFMAARTGSEMAVFDMARALGGRGQTVGLFASVMSGRWRKQLMGHDIEAVDDVGQLTFRPQIIHGQHVVAFASCLQAFPECSVVQWIHDLTDPLDQPLRHPNIAAHVAVDEARAKRARDAGAAEANVHVIPNAVDLQRFALRPLNGNRQALCIIKRVGLDETVPVIRRACERAGWQVTFRGAGVGDEIDDIAQAYVGHDLVITSGRTALEAVAMGRNVVVCDYGGYGGAVDGASWRRLRATNFGLNAMTGALQEDVLAEQLALIDAEAGHLFGASIRSSLDLEAIAETVEALYMRVLRTHVPLASLAEREAMTADLVLKTQEASTSHLAHWRRVAATRD